MDTRKLHEDLVVTIHNDGQPEELTEITVGEAGGQTVGYMDPGMAEELVKRWNAYPELLAALEALELRCAQARIASSIGKPRLKDADFLRHECERMAKDARAAIAKATGETL